MTLPLSGPLSISAISTELYGSVGSDISLRLLASNAGGMITPDGFDEFYGYTVDSSIGYDYSGTITTYGLNISEDKDLYQSLNFTGISDTDVISLNVNITAEASSTAPSRVLYAINSTTIWTTLLFLTTSVVDSNLSIPGVEQGDTVLVRINTNSTAGNRTTTVSLLGGSFTTGAGDITAVGTTSWAVTVSNNV
jgi:hypothetical protein